MKTIIALSAFILTFGAQAQMCETHSFKGPSNYSWDLLGEASDKEECPETFIEIKFKRTEDGFSEMDIDFDLRCTEMSHSFGIHLPMTGLDILKDTWNEETQSNMLKRFGLVHFNDNQQLESISFDYFSGMTTQTINLERISATAFSLNYYVKDPTFFDHVFSYRLNPNGISIKSCDL